MVLSLGRFLGLDGQQSRHAVAVGRKIDVLVVDGAPRSAAYRTTSAPCRPRRNALHGISRATIRLSGVSKNNLCPVRDHIGYAPPSFEIYLPPLFSRTLWHEERGGPTSNQALLTDARSP